MKKSFEVENLPADTPMLIGMDLFPILGFSIAGIPVDYPDSKGYPTLIEAEEPESLVSKDPIV